jgi:hypothetical protein
MRFRIAFPAVALAAFVAGATAAEPNPRNFGWLPDLAAGKAEAKRTGKPMLVVFRCER